MGDPDFVVVKDASGHGVGGIIIGKGETCVPTVFLMEWSQYIKDALVSELNPTGTITITNSDLECACLLLLWLIMEDVCALKLVSHGDNQQCIGCNTWHQEAQKMRNSYSAPWLYG